MLSVLQQSAQSVDRRTRSSHDRGRRGRQLLYPFRGGRLDGAARDAVHVPAGLRRLCRIYLLSVPSLRVEMAFRLAAGPDEHRSRVVGAGGVAAGRRLFSGGAERVRPILLRQDHDRALLGAADRPAERLADGLPVFPLHAHPPACALAAIESDPGARPRCRRRGAAAVDRERRGEQCLAGRNPVVVARRPGAEHSRHSGARQLRDARCRRQRSGATRHAPSRG